MRKIRVIFLSLITLSLLFFWSGNSGVSAVTWDQGYLNTKQTKGGNYGVYSADHKNNEGTTKADWYNGGAGTVYIKMSTTISEKSKSGGHLQPGGNPTIVYDYGVAVQHHRYLGIPAY